MRGWILLGLITAVGCSSPMGSSTSSATGSSGATGSTTAASTGGASTGTDSSSSTTGAATSSVGSSSSASSTSGSTSSIAASSSGSSSGSTGKQVGRPTPPCDPDTSTPLPDGGCVCDQRRCPLPGYCGFTTYCCSPYGTPCDPVDGGSCCGGVCSLSGTCALCTALGSSCSSTLDCCQGACLGNVCQL